MRNESDSMVWPRYGLAQRVLHWLVAVLVLGAVGLGGTIGWFGFEGLQARFGEATTNTIYTWHKSFGVLILALMLVRIGLRIRRGKPGYAVDLARWQRVGSEAVHGLLYVLLIAMPVIGWWGTAAGGYPVQLGPLILPGLFPENEALSETLFAWHQALGRVTLILVVGHVAAALYHWRVRRDGVMQRMTFGRTRH
ncbi:MULTISPECIES: cytochrome b [unclassified Thioalkalivibrio]|uniref:cytochrome b n=1 Tax=unclassified Thioalkalivibrio TaxID=2621013 RepID=UPI00038140E4|nr:MULTISPECIES: cytochrome b [unclassified Thioalkalivibrio]